MRKTELIHLHSHLRLRRVRYAAEIDDETFEEYESLGVSPTHVHRPKATTGKPC
ncbi:UPF0058 family protein [Halostella sp. PRR32]|uniref:UPF0058 family protein n=1 Tax=Halostella sp. PRR32 TaxID=3098147 RepID=UPI002B1DE03F|nr:UPF0058 family protein [Halostella sp. PRR32]